MSDQGKAEGIAIALARLREAMEVAGMSGDFGLTVAPRDATVLKMLPRQFTSLNYEPYASNTHHADGRVEQAVVKLKFAGVPIN
jgi:hypothetical protein